MPTAQQIDADLKTAMLSKNSGAVSVLRMLKSEIKNSEIARSTQLTKEDVISVIRKEVKKRRESAAMYRSGNNIQQAGIEEAEAELLENYLPAPVGEEIIVAYIKEAISHLEHPSSSDKGALIKQTLSHFGGEADGRLVATLINTLLAESNGS